MKITKLKDQNNLVPTSKFPSYAKFPFEKFNPIQSRAFEIFREDSNLIVAAATSAGKTIIGEFYLANEIRERGGKGLYLAPMKALAKEKIDDWSENHFSDLKFSIVTGDFRSTSSSSKKELEEANLILMTNEMLSSKCRNFKSENNEYLKQIKTVVIDEFHIISANERGSHIEIGLMKFLQIVPDARIVCLSATMPNAEELAQWISKITNKHTYLLESTYRPCPLGIHYESYFPESWKYEENEREKVNTAMRIVHDYPDDKFLIFAQTKRTGEMMKQALLREKFECEFHSADLDKEKRHSLEKRFRSGKLQILVATSTMAVGVNLPARRVIVLGVHRGVQLVDTYDIWQEVGRAGRPGYDPRGDAYILLPDEDSVKHMNRLKEHQPIVSRLLDYVGEEERRYKTLAFHLVSEIHHGYVKNKEEMHQWYERSLAHFQAQDLHDSIVDSTLESLLKINAIKIEDGEYKATTIGIIASMFYFSPFDVADLRRNFKMVIGTGKEEDDVAISMALGNVDTQRLGIVSKAEKAEMFGYMKKVSDVFGGSVFTESALKAGFAYNALLSGKDAGAVAAYARGLQFDFPRTIQVLNTIDSMICKWNKKSYFRILQLRMLYGVRKELVGLIEIPDIGRVRAERLFSAGIKTPKDVLNNASRLSSVLNLSSDRCNAIIEATKGLV